MIGDQVEFGVAQKTASTNKQRIWSSTGKGGSGFERISGHFPDLKINPKFKISKDANFFTIGSCFAREVESALQALNITSLTLSALFPATYYALAKSEAYNGALNVYTPASMRDLLSLGSRPNPMEIAALQVGDDWYDMLLSGFRPLTREEFDIARGILVSTYAQLSSADVVVVTLGFTEAWLDTHDHIYVNRSPAATMATVKAGARYNFHNLAAPQVMDMLENIVSIIQAQTNDRAKIVFTTSPVPLHATFGGADVISANTYSKSTLVSAANWIASKYDFVDYFPSYEFVTHMRRDLAYIEDGVHVNRDVVAAIMKLFVESYIE
ncbi:hypothetical protein M2360_001785 [Rhizobium sp. SG_E_25_P2]|uniref:GSCFA domain-containing protein n=1 Tax=Rhizobium sp. SG_E_25_P2 TaxID=2879942 RepID=UPI00247641B3|nr:GSCFA domain-containing protein [Rhizobium sp. SG_E_25_P2]MDH6266389.1 hypothetical protein [Rhizobium sp. SG_E_25_P2]